MKKKTIAVSGGFDPIHAGHVRMILDAATYGDVIVILNTDDWLNRKKGYAFMLWEERAEILRSIRGVVSVVSDDKDNTVCKTLGLLKEDINLDMFANGGDRILNNTPEMNLCKDIGVSLLWNCGGEKIQSSSQLIEKRKWSKDGAWNKPEKKNRK